MESIDVRGFIQEHISPYEGDESFLSPISETTQLLKDQFQQLLEEEGRRGGVYDVDVERIASLLTFDPGYLDKSLETIVGLQTDVPLKRAVNPFGGIRMARQACEAYGYHLSEAIEKAFEFKTTHNDGVFRIYSEDMRKARRMGLITGLPDAYGRGRIIGDYRRVALYGMKTLMETKKYEKEAAAKGMMDEETIRHIEELHRQLEFMAKLVKMADAYGDDITRPATSAREAIQWTYYAYLAAVKEQNGAAMSLGRVSSFFDIYIEKDMQEERLTEVEAQALIDQFVLKLRMVRQLRTPEYNALFAGDPNWITEAIGGMGQDGRTLVTKTSYRFIHTLTTLSPSPEPNLTILWSHQLPKAFKRYCAYMSMKTDALQYENDDLMRPIYGDDYGIACCVSAMAIGKQMQFFGARCNLPKLLLLAINGGYDPVTGMHIGPSMEPISAEEFTYDTIYRRYSYYVEWMAELYVNTMNIIHRMHDKYAYEKIQMALHDSQVERFMAFGIAGFSVMADSFSAIYHGAVEPIYDGEGYVIDYRMLQTYPTFGNGIDQVDKRANRIVEDFLKALQKHPTYRHAKHTLSLLTITSNVVYGKKTGATPDGRKAGEPFAPGANPMHRREQKGPLAAGLSVAHIPYEICQDGISYTFSILPQALGKTEGMRRDNLVGYLDAYFSEGGHHMNVNVLDPSVLKQAMEKPEAYTNLTIRVSGYAVRFVRLSREQQEEVIMRTYHDNKVSIDHI